MIWWPRGFRLFFLIFNFFFFLPFFFRFLYQYMCEVRNAQCQSRSLSAGPVSLTPSEHHKDNRTLAGLFSWRCTCFFIVRYSSYGSIHFMEKYPLFSRSKSTRVSKFLMTNRQNARINTAESKTQTREDSYITSSGVIGLRKTSTTICVSCHDESDSDETPLQHLTWQPFLWGSTKTTWGSDPVNTASTSQLSSCNLNQAK